ncbi:tyrosine-protein phosphatase [Microbacterium xanthum]|uniref:tyrosine-protein phosphatase n=1 Tax=Microbacterium xanthum TaxID=3079794 RepID=UPI002AD56F3E|nr:MULTISPECIES: tyrosine-protein phosphatase [unclassified Microbacterium]MDZ8171533.1 tyrosine-protein phosphatase [Microbacterium sp. KSW-48]MDZ8200428.1 tyrosine-protein phosphatase [Microbacterium sp. SSW1-59]
MIEIPGLVNVRDVGDYPTVDGSRTRSSVLFRSDALSGLTADGLTALSRSPIREIVDLRTPDERAAAPDRLPTTPSIRSIDAPLLQGAVSDLLRDAMDPAAPATTLDEIPTLGELYCGMLDDGATVFADIARRLAASTGAEALLIHCTAGKDRTGVATALLLDAVGVERAAVVADYTASQERLAGPWADRMLGMIAGLGVPLTPRLRALVCETPASAIEEALEKVDALGGSASYLRNGGLTTPELAHLRSRLTG